MSTLLKKTRSTQHITKREFELGDWRVDPLAHTLTNNNENKSLRLPVKVIGVFEYLALNHERLVTREEIIEVIWSGNALVGERALNNAVWRLRRALDDDSDEPRYIKTILKTGYQLIGKPHFIDPALRSKPISKVSRMKVYSTIAALTVGLAGLLIFSLNEGAPQFTGNLEQATVLVKMPGREIYPAPSPDGKSIAFHFVDRKSNHDIYIKPIENNGELPQRITFSALQKSMPAWSPNGNYLAYYTSEVLKKNCTIVLLNMRESHETNIGSCVEEAGNPPTISWSPDGRWLLYPNVEPGIKPGLYLKNMDPFPDPEAAFNDQRISCTDCLFIDEDASWSPDSTKLAITRSRHRLSEDIYVYTLQDNRFIQITSGERNIKGLTWYKDGIHLLYVSNNTPSNRRLWVVNTETGQSRELGYANAGSPAYLPDYQSFVFHRHPVNHYIASMSIDGDENIKGFPAPIIQTSNSQRNPSYSEINDKITYYSDAGGYNELWISNFDGSGARQLTNLRQSNVDPSWSPDGKTIAFISLNSKSNTNELKLVDVKTGDVRTLETGFVDHGYPNWSRDGKSLIVPLRSGEKFDLWRISPEDNKLENKRLTFSGGIFGRESPDGQFVYFTREIHGKLYRLPSAGGAEEIVSKQVQPTGLGTWDWVGPRQLIYLKYHPGMDHVEMVLLELDTLHQQKLLEIPLRTILTSGMLSYARPHNMLIFTVQQQPQIDIYIAPDPLAVPGALPQ